MITGIELIINVDQVLRGMGADPVKIRERRPVIVEAAEWALAEGMHFIDAKATHSRYEIASLRHDRILLSGNKKIASRLLAQHLGPAQELIVCLCTIGNDLEALGSQLILEEPLQGLAIEGLGNAAIEVLANSICGQFEAEAAASGMQASIPLSPGMVGWPVAEGQRQIFDLLNADEIGVELGESAMMNPRKSLSMAVGVGFELSTKGKTCDYCNLKETCQYQDHYS